jgi:hypothetical protein
MPEEFDPAWEYACADPEIEEIVYWRQGTAEMQLFDPRAFHNDWNTGLRFGTGNPNRGGVFKLASRKPEREKKEKPVREERRCSNYTHCRKWFVPPDRKPNQKYCCAACRVTCVSKYKRELPIRRLCRWCKKYYRPKRSAQKFCCRQHGQEWTQKLQKDALCTICGKTIPFNKVANNNKGKYCSVKCKKKRNNAVYKLRRKYIKGGVNVSVKVGDKVMLEVPDNLQVHKQFAVVKETTLYGAIVSWRNNTREFRAFAHEMIPVVSTGNQCDKCGSSNLVRAGTCLVCQDCGDTSGGCG